MAAKPFKPKAPFAPKSMDAVGQPPLSEGGAGAPISRPPRVKYMATRSYGKQTEQKDPSTFFSGIGGQ